MFKGSMPALITPFKNGKVDFDALKHLVDWQITEGSHGLVPVGTTGESATLSHSEHEYSCRYGSGQQSTHVPPFLWYLPVWRILHLSVRHQLCPSLGKRIFVCR